MDQKAADDYRAAFDAWIAHLTRVHAVLLDHEPLDPMHRIALIRRESHLKERYEEARRHFLGIPGDDSDSPFPE